MTGKVWTPGASDADFGLLFKAGSAEEEISFLRRFWRWHSVFKRPFPFLGEVQILNTLEADAVAWPASNPDPKSDTWKFEWDCLHEAISACLFLLQQTYFASTPEQSPDFGFKISKGCLDVLRFCAALESSPSQPPMERRAYRKTMRETGIRKILENPLSLNPSAALEVCIFALKKLDVACHQFITAVQNSRTASRQAPTSSWDHSVTNSELFSWQARLKTLEEARFPRIRGFYMDNLYRWQTIADVHNAAAVKRLFEQLLSWHRNDPQFSAPPLVLSLDIFQVLLWTGYLDTPFFYYTLTSHLTPLALSARTRGSSPLLAARHNERRIQWKLSASECIPPPSDFLVRGAQRSLSNLALSLRLFGMPGWAGSNTYRFCLLYSRLLSALLYFRKNQLTDPDDLEELMRLLENHLPEHYARVREPVLATLNLKPDYWDSLDPDRCFYQHYPTYQYLLHEALAASRADA